MLHFVSSCHTRPESQHKPARTMKVSVFLLGTVALCLLQLTCTSFAAVNVDNLIAYAVDKYTAFQAVAPAPGRFISTGVPTSTRWADTDIGAWTCGFYAGTLWMLHKLTGDQRWRILAEENQQGLFLAQFDRETHDTGFIIMSSYGHGLELTGNRNFETPIIQAAISLCSRYFHLAGVIRSWNNGQPTEGEVKVIIDNMMNLNMLFKAYELTNNTYFRDIALSHADKTIEEHIRPDFGTYHVVGFEESNGTVRRKYTAQGYQDWSTWARGHAWGILGYIETYKNTMDRKYLQVAQDLALYFTTRLPSDYVPYWDFDAPYSTSYQPRDTAAAAVAAVGLLELYNATRLSYYFGIAELILQNLDSPRYRADGQPGYQIPAVLVNGTVHYNNNEFNTAIVYADYYFLRALDLYRQLA